MAVLLFTPTSCSLVIAIAIAIARYLTFRFFRNLKLYSFIFLFDSSTDMGPFTASLLRCRTKFCRIAPIYRGVATSSAAEPAHIKAIVDQIGQLKFHEVTLLNEALKRELKIPDVQRVAAAGPVGGGEGEESAAAVKSSYTVKLAKFDDTKKVALIKEIKKLVEGINLVEAKRFVEECPRVIKSNLTKEEAEALQKQLEAAGGVVKLE